MGTAALFGEPGLHPAAGLKPERSAAPKGGGIDLLHGVGRSSSAPSRVPGPPPRTSIAATACRSKMTAVTPDVSLASSA
jgi:hypothetical protein